MKATWGPVDVEVPAIEGSPMVPARQIRAGIVNGEALVFHPKHDGAVWRPTPREAVAIYRAWALDQQEEAQRQQYRAKVAFDEVRAGLEREAELRANLALVRTNVDDVWYWQGRDGKDDGNYPESLACPVVMSADTLRAMLARAERAEALVDAMHEHHRNPTEATRDAVEALESA